MNSQLNETHDPDIRSWVESANTDGDFPIQNLPHGVFSREQEAPRGGIAIGDHVLDMDRACAAGLFNDMEAVARAAAMPDLIGLMSFSATALTALRRRIFALLRLDSAESAGLRAIADRALLKRREVSLRLPCQPRNFTDFLTARHHIARSPRLSPNGDVPPQFLHLPLAYNGRASTIVTSGTPVRRPLVQSRGSDGTVAFGPCSAFDFELEVGLFVRGGNDLGTPISIHQAGDHRFGYCLLNDWSSRDLQSWECVLAPFLSKSASTTISPWIVTHEALLPFRVPASDAAPGDPEPFAYLTSPENSALGGLDIGLTAHLETGKMCEMGAEAERLTATNLSKLYWTFDQMIAQHTSNGCNLVPGDLLGSGTVSGLEASSRACLSEINERGRASLTLANGEKRIWLEDGDEVTFTARAERPGFVPIGFGECRGRVEPALPGIEERHGKNVRELI